MVQVIRTGPDGALLDPQAFINFARSHPQVMRDLPPHLVQAVNQGDVEALQSVFRFVHLLILNLIELKGVVNLGSALHPCNGQAICHVPGSSGVRMGKYVL